jgi:hypothetical protein
MSDVQDSQDGFWIMPKTDKQVREYGDDYVAFYTTKAIIEEQDVEYLAGVPEDWDA